jgi:hypothetical protein
MLYILGPISLAMITIILFMALSLSSVIDNFHEIAVEKSNVIFLRDYVDFTIKNPTSFAKVLAIGDTDNTCNQSLQCVYHHTDCSVALAGQVGIDNNGNPATGPTAFQEITCLYDPSGDNIIFRSASATSGLKSDTTPCNSFSTTNPDNLCSYRPEVRWRPLCPTAPCANSGLEIRIEIKIGSASKLKLNTNKRIAREIVYY